MERETRPYTETDLTKFTGSDESLIWTWAPINTSWLQKQFSGLRAISGPTSYQMGFKGSTQTLQCNS